MDNAPQIFLAEVFGTGALVLLGDAVVAGVLLNRSKAQNSGWIVITTAWAFAVFMGVLIAGPFSGAHLNPAVTLVCAQRHDRLDLAVVYWAAELLGAFIGAVLVFLHYFPHWSETEDADLKLAVYSTGPAIRNTAVEFLERVPRHVRAGVRDLHHRRTPGTTASLRSARCRSRSSSWSSACPLAAPPATRSTLPATSARASPTSCSRSPASATPTGRTRGSPSSARSLGGAVAYFVYNGLVANYLMA